MGNTITSTTPSLQRSPYESDQEYQERLQLKQSTGIAVPGRNAYESDGMFQARFTKSKELHVAIPAASPVEALHPDLFEVRMQAAQAMPSLVADAAKPIYDVEAMRQHLHGLMEKGKAGSGNGSGQ